MNDIEKLIKLLEHAESFSLEAYGKSPNLSECSLNIQYLRACILQAIGNAKALRERLANDKTDREIMQQALDSMLDAMRVSGGISDKMFESVNAISERLAQPEIEAALAPERELPWLRAIDEAMIVHHIGVADPADDYETAKRKVNNLLCHAQDIGAYFAKQAEPEQEPVVVIKRNESGQIIMQTPDGNPFDMSKYIGAKLYATPQKREWQGLTDEESNRLVMEHLGPHALTGGKMSVYDAFLLAIRATEAKLKEKNT